MASKKTTTIALFLVLNFMFFTLSSACNSCPTPKPKPPPKPKACPPPPKPKTPTPTKPTPTPSKPTPTPSPTVPTPTPSKPTPTPSPTMPTPTPSKPTPTPSPSKPTCPRDILKLGVCADLLGGLIGVTIGSPENSPCCTLIGGLADLDAAVCLCTAIKANVLGINLNVPISLSVLLNVCERKIPEGFKCE